MKVVERLPSTLMSSVVAGPHSSVLDDFELLLATAIVDSLWLARRFVQHWHAHGEVLGVLRLRVLLELECGPGGEGALHLDGAAARLMNCRGSEGGRFRCHSRTRVSPA